MLANVDGSIWMWSTSEQIRRYALHARTRPAGAVETSSGSAKRLILGFRALAARILPVRRSRDLAERRGDLRRCYQLLSAAEYTPRCCASASLGLTGARRGRE